MINGWEKAGLVQYLKDLAEWTKDNGEHQVVRNFIDAKNADEVINALEKMSELFKRETQVNDKGQLPELQE